MAKKGKKYLEAAKLVDSSSLYSVVEAIELAKKTSTVNFDATVEVAFRLGVDTRKNDQQVRGAVVLPKGTGKTAKTMDVTKAVNEIKAGKVEYRAEKAGVVHTPIGKVSFSTEDLVENFNAVQDALAKAKPAAAKGTYFKSVAVTTTMGPGVRVNTAEFK